MKKKNESRHAHSTIRMLIHYKIKSNRIRKDHDWCVSAPMCIVKNVQHIECIYIYFVCMALFRFFLIFCFVCRFIFFTFLLISSFYIFLLIPYSLFNMYCVCIQFYRLSCVQVSCVLKCMLNRFSTSYLYGALHLYHHIVYNLYHI